MSRITGTHTRVFASDDSLDMYDVQPIRNRSAQTLHSTYICTSYIGNHQARGGGGRKRRLLDRRVLRGAAAGTARDGGGAVTLLPPLMDQVAPVHLRAHKTSLGKCTEYCRLNRGIVD